MSDENNLWNLMLDGLVDADVFEDREQAEMTVRLMSISTLKDVLQRIAWNVPTYTDVVRCHVIEATTIDCPDCGEDVPTEDGTACPNCGWVYNEEADDA